MHNISRLIKASAVVIRAHREAKRAHADGASPEAKARYQKAVVKALDALDPIVVDVAKEASRKERQLSSAPFDWNGALSAVVAGLKLVDRIKGGASPREVIDIFDAEVIDSKARRG